MQLIDAVACFSPRWRCVQRVDASFRECARRPLRWQNFSEAEIRRARRFAFSSTQLALLDSLKNVFHKRFLWELAEASIDERILPTNEGMTLIQSICDFLVPAKIASYLTDVPVSLLMAEAQRHNLDFDPRDVFETGETFPSIEACFLDLACHFAISKKLRKVLRVANGRDSRDLREYLNELKKCAYWDREDSNGDGEDRAHSIECERLYELDTDPE
jgi:hypothetical protein